VTLLVRLEPSGSWSSFVPLGEADLRDLTAASASPLLTAIRRRLGRREAIGREPASTVLQDIRRMKRAFLHRTGREATTLVLGDAVAQELCRNWSVLELLHHTDARNRTTYGLPSMLRGLKVEVDEGTYPATRVLVADSTDAVELDVPASDLACLVRA
jgi:hypothetical protein